MQWLGLDGLPGQIPEHAHLALVSPEHGILVGLVVFHLLLDIVHGLLGFFFRGSINHLLDGLIILARPPGREAQPVDGLHERLNQVAVFFHLQVDIIRQSHDLLFDRPHGLLGLARDLLEQAFLLGEAGGCQRFQFRPILAGVHGLGHGFLGKMALGQLPVQLLCVGIHVLLQHRLQWRRCLPRFSIRLDAREPVQDDILISTACFDGLLSQIHVFILQSLPESLPLLVHPVLELVFLLFRQVCHEALRQVFLGLVFSIFFPALVDIFFRLIQQFLAARFRDITVTVVERHLVNLFFGGNHAVHDAAHRQAWLHVIPNDGTVDADQEGTELAEHRPQAFRWRMAIVQVHLEGTGEALLLPDKFQKLCLFRVPLLLCGNDGHFPVIKLLFEPRILIQLIVIRMPGSPLLHDMKFLSGNIINLGQVLEVHQEHVPHLM